MKQKVRERLARDFWLLVLSIMFAVYVAHENVVPSLLAMAHSGEYLASFIAGMFFTSLFTIAPAAVALGTLSLQADPFLVALFGAAGAVAGDLILFLFVEGTLADDFNALFAKRKWAHRLGHAVRSPLMRWVMPIIGALVIASPLPDELGVALLGLSHLRLTIFIPISFAMNFLGILAVAGIVSVF